MTPQSATNSGSRRTTGLVTAALLAFSATTAPTSVEAARVSSKNARAAAAAARRLEHDVPQPADATFVVGPQCVKCCKPPPTMDEIRQDGGAGGTGTGGGPPKPPGGSPGGKGKGTSASGGGPAPGGRRTKNRSRRLAARGKDGKRAQEFRELVRKYSWFCFEVNAFICCC